MKNKLIMKGLVFGIIMLFVGTSVVPASTNINQEKAKDKDNITKTTEAPIYNIIGGCNITFNFPIKKSIQWVWWNATDRNFTYPIINGTVDVNYTFILQCYSTGTFYIPRFAWLITTLYYDINTSRGSKTEFTWVFYKDTIPGKVAKVYVHCKNRMPTPPPDPNSNKTKMWAFQQLRIFVFPPTFFDDYNRRKFFIEKESLIPFWTNFT